MGRDQRKPEKRDTYADGLVACEPLAELLGIDRLRFHSMLPFRFDVRATLTDHRAPSTAPLKRKGGPAGPPLPAFSGSGNAL